MKAVDLALLLARFGPIALEWLEELTLIWTKEMTPEEIREFCVSKRKSLEDFYAAERARRQEGGGV